MNQHIRCLLVSYAVVGACTKVPPVDETPRPPAAPAANIAAASGAKPKDHEVFGAGETVAGVSIYDLTVPLIDQENQPTALDVFRGHPVLISMFYTTCPQACPILISHLKRIEAALDPAVRSDLRVLLVSFDPAHDTTAVLHEAVSHFDVDGTRWKLTRTDDEHVREVGAVLGIKYRQSDGSFNHSSVITLLDRAGVIDRRADGMGDAVASMSARVTELSSTATP